VNNPPDHNVPIDAMTFDQRCIVFTPVGYRYSFILAALTKRFLLHDEIQPADKLELLERLHSLVDFYFTTEMLATIEPASDTEWQIYETAETLDPADDKRARASFDILTSGTVFDHICTLNPSILAAIKMKSNAALIRRPSAAATFST
jgi:hypothetical protein